MSKSDKDYGVTQYIVKFYRFEGEQNFGFIRRILKSKKKKKKIEAILFYVSYKTCRVGFIINQTSRVNVFERDLKSYMRIVT